MISPGTCTRSIAHSDRYGSAMKDSSTKVLLFTDTFCDINGVSRFLQDISRLAHQSSLQLYVVTASAKKCPSLPNVHLLTPKIRRKIPFYPELDLVLPSYRALREITADLAPDVVHISTPGFVGLMGRRIARKRSLPMIGTYHTDFPAFAYKNIPLGIVRRIVSGYMRYFYKSFTLLFVRSEAYWQIVSEDVGFDPERVRVLRAGVDVGKFNPSYRDLGIWKHYGIPADATKALYVGRLSREKNFPLLLELWKEHFQKSPDKNIYLVVVGGDVDEELERYHICSLGIKRGEELSRIYAGSDLLLFPSTTDTLGQAVMEAMSSGLPVIVSDQGGPKTLIREEQRAGYAIDVADRQQWLDKIDALMSHPGCRAEFGAHGHEIIADMGIEKSFVSFWREHCEEAGRTDCREAVTRSGQ